MALPSREALWSAGKDETVEVNQRALIDKILARYSGEHTIFRELLQNADDAGAQHVQVKFYTKAGLEAAEQGRPPPSLPDVKEPICRYVVCNDGIPFRPEDWHRLKKIAEGNPDEEKIGAFGVGFYSLWSVCDDPFVESGNKWMGFYWKDGKDQLVARSGDLPPDHKPAQSPTVSGNPWTSFTMALREPTALDAPLEFARFLVTSLTFMRTIKRIDMLVDDTNVLEVRKDVKGQHTVSRPNLYTASPGGMMRVYSVDATSMVITARVMKWLSATGIPTPSIPPPTVKKVGGLLSSFFGRVAASAPTPEAPATPPPADNPTEVDILAREIQTYQADIKVSVPTSFAKELERATKKAPPTRMPASLVFSREDETATTAEGKAADNKKAAAVFAGLCPPLDGEKSAKVFIGQPTGQTTGIGGHLAARFIPTVERESIDLVDRHVSQWNKELLWVGGYLSRLIYELELVDLATQWTKTTSTETATRAQILARGLHALRFFSFRPTTPSAAVGTEMESAFFGCARYPHTLPLISTGGILAIDKVRIPNAQLLEFLPDLAVLTPATVTDAPRMVSRLRERNLLREINFEDAVSQLNQRPLTEKEMIACLDWWQSIASVDGFNAQVRNRLLQAAILITDNSKIVLLGSVKTYVNPSVSHIPTDMPLPQDTIPYSVTKQLKASTMNQVFGWAELTIPAYIHYLINPPMTGAKGADPDTDMCVNPAFAERVIMMLGRAWQNMNGAKQQEVVTLLKDVACIPTRAGFKKPGESYFEKNLLFDDLPTLALPKTTNIRGGVETMLLAIGVRRTVDLQLIFSRLIGGGEWSCLDLMKYLVSVRNTLSSDEIARLRQTAAFPLEQPPEKDGSKSAVVRQKPLQLYEPTDTMRELGLPLLDWGEHKWKSNSEEAKMLYSLGLRRFPPADVLLGIAAGPSPKNHKALDYLLTHTNTSYIGFNANKYTNVAFIPATNATGSQILAKPGEVFTNAACKVLGFSVARPPASLPENASKLSIPTDPPMTQLVAAFMAAPETDIARSRSIFEYLATRVGSSPLAAILPLSNKAFIPVQEKKTEKGPGAVRLARPDEVFLASGKQDDLYTSAFTFVDFGHNANMFLRQVGVKSEPSHKDIARLLLRQSDRILNDAGRERYLEQLRILAANVNAFDRDMLAAMRNTPFLLASQTVLKEKRSGDSDEDYRREWVLCKASESIIVDNSTFQSFFGKYVLAAPEEHLLEVFYKTLGAHTLSSRVAVDCVPSGVRSTPSREAVASRKFMLERLTIFLGHFSRKVTDYGADYLSKGDNFVVSEADSIVARYTYRDGPNTHQHVEQLYAMATRSARRTISVTLARNMEPDFYDVSNALCTAILKQPKLDDILMLESILRTPLMALKKRGFNVDRILNAQREELLRKRAEASKEREAAQAQAQAVSRAGEVAAGKEAMQAGPNNGAGLVPMPQPGGDAGGQGIMNMIRRIGQQKPGGVKMPQMPGTANGGIVSHSSQSSGPQSHKSTARPSDVEKIRSTARQAVAASKPGGGAMTIESTRRNINYAPESKQDYCDPSAEANIRMVHNPGEQSCQVWLPLDQQQFEGDQFAISQRFIDKVLLPLAGVYKVSPAVINVFWDREGPLIAFNRNGTIYCNARYYEAWHDAEIQRGELVPALISWYFSFAHELAHNLESGHNASHEFYFSSIAEEYLIPFGKLLGGGGV